MLRGGSGLEFLHGENGSDTYYGGSGRDVLTELNGDSPLPVTGEGYTGKDVMFGEGGTDWLEGARNDDELHGGPNAVECSPCYWEILSGNTGDDDLYGEDGHDWLQGHQGSDLMSGGAGDDFIDAAIDETAGTPDTVKCGSGFDTVIADANDIVAEACEDVRPPA